MLVEVREFECQTNTSGDKMVENLRANMAHFLPSIKAKRAVVVGGGPSAAERVEEIAALQAEGFEIFALNGATKFLQSAGIMPDCGVVYDARDDNLEFVEGALCPMRGWLIASHASPMLLSYLVGRGDRVKLFHSLAASPMLGAIREHEPNAHILGPGITVGIQVLNILVMLGYRIVKLYGYDSSSRPGAHHAYAQPLNDGRREMEFNFQGSVYRADPVMAAQAQEIIRLLPVLENMGVVLAVVGDGLFPHMWLAREAKKAALAAGPVKTLEEIEADKYNHCWRTAEYRKSDTARELVEEFVPFTGGPCNVIDFGCGAGRATKELQDLGYEILGIDIAADCLDPESDIPFLQACLWELPDDLLCEVGFCADVLEHIPPSHVDRTLDAIANACERGLMANIALFKDEFGGGHLHLSVHPAEWWEAALRKRFAKVRMVRTDGRTALFECVKE